MLVLVFLTGDLHLGAAAIGLGFAVGSTGGLVASALSRRLVAALGETLTMVLGLLCILCGRFAIGLAPPTRRRSRSRSSPSRWR